MPRERGGIRAAFEMVLGTESRHSPPAAIPYVSSQSKRATVPWSVGDRVEKVSFVLYPLELQCASEWQLAQHFLKMQKDIYILKHTRWPSLKWACMLKWVHIIFSFCFTAVSKSTMCLVGQGFLESRDVKSWIEHFEPWQPSCSICPPREIPNSTRHSQRSQPGWHVTWFPHQTRWCL